MSTLNSLSKKSGAKQEVLVVLPAKTGQGNSV